MLDAAALKAGGRVLMVSSLDEDHPGENVIDGNERTYWISTGLYPQELLLQLCHPSWVSSLLVSATHVRQLRIEGCHEDVPINFQVLADGDLGDGRGSMQVQELHCQKQERPVQFIRMLILSGWHDFCSVHRLQVKATSPSPEELAALAPSIGQDHSRKSGTLGYSQAQVERLTRSSSSVSRSDPRRPSKAPSDLHVDIPPHQFEHDEPDAPRSMRLPWREGEENDLLSPKHPASKSTKSASRLFSKSSSRTNNIQ